MWTYHNPVEVIFGTGKLNDLDVIMEQYGMDRALIVADPFTQMSGTAEKIKEYAGGRIVGIFSGLEPNPTYQNVEDRKSVV